MKTILFASLFIFIISCDSQKQSDRKQELPQKEEIVENSTAIENIWNQFAMAFDEQDIDFLLSHSLDTIQCANCDWEADSEYFPAKTAFKQHFQALKHLESLINADHSVHKDENMIRVNYSVKSEQAPEGGYNVIYTFVKQEGQYFFQGMFTIP